MIDDYPEIVAAFGGVWVPPYFFNRPGDGQMERIYEIITEYVDKGTLQRCPVPGEGVYGAPVLIRAPRASKGPAVSEGGGKMSIKVLAPDVAAKIAAGEVVDRPLSVVKELVENSLDAGASQITVEVRGGGVQLIRITDDGRGIPAEDVELAFHRHATSKVSSVSDLDSIATLGFRGEALPSIAAVSRISLGTRPHDSSAGRELRLNWGEVVRSGTMGCPPRHFHSR